MVLRFIVLHRVEVLLGTRNLVFSHHHCSDAADPRRQIDFLPMLWYSVALYFSRVITRCFKEAHENFRIRCVIVCFVMVNVVSSWNSDWGHWSWQLRPPIDHACVWPSYVDIL